ncbi:pectin lyase fold/virulence factor [Protomyces lactucae-debilis]|uniref:galacturonan 1,4-alpha-galacturonidase n=1 Tax=Protomyces lactucae-debilis TaxID=2754530 RepID=A0A1Y2EWV5_PROLT|nr:pectin lyase fold/virulence factor [Protomyces lactucae-debilis]ORY76063.1 pectin lyase fold/virulence factor [Protomyces lactucae-debilis]
MLPQHCAIAAAWLQLLSLGYATAQGLSISSSHLLTSNAAVKPNPTEANVAPKVCSIKANMNGISKDLLQAAQACKSNGHIIIEAGDSLIDNVVVMADLKDVTISIQGTLHLKADPVFWAQNAYKHDLVNFQNSSAAILFRDCEGLKFGGAEVFKTGSTIIGYGAPFWSAYLADNTIMRPNLVTLQRCTNCEISNLRFLDTPKWAMYVTDSDHVNIHDMMIQSIGGSVMAMNTDGIDIRNSTNVEFHNNYIDNTDDCVAIKGMCSNIYVHDIICGSKTAGVAIGSLGNIVGVNEFVKDVVIQDVLISGTPRGGIRIKIWPGNRVKAKELLGGGGLADVHNITASRIHTSDNSQALYIDTCYSLGRTNSNCYGYPSLGTITDVTIDGIYGTSPTGSFGHVLCSNPSKCQNIKINNVIMATAVDTASGIGTTAVLNTVGVPPSILSGAPADIGLFDLSLPNGCYLERAAYATDSTPVPYFAPKPRDRPLGYLDGVPKTPADCLQPGSKWWLAQGQPSDFTLSTTSYKPPVYPKVHLSQIPASRVKVSPAFPKNG